jgi:hypothetical protein
MDNQVIYNPEQNRLSEASETFVPDILIQSVHSICRYGFGEIRIVIQHGKVTCIHATKTIKDL